MKNILEVGRVPTILRYLLPVMGIIRCPRCKVRFSFDQRDILIVRYRQSYGLEHAKLEMSMRERLSHWWNQLKVYRKENQCIYALVTCPMSACANHIAFTRIYIPQYKIDGILSLKEIEEKSNKPTRKGVNIV